MSRPRYLLLDSFAVVELARLLVDAIAAGVELTPNRERLVFLVSAEARRDSPTTTSLDMAAAAPDADPHEQPFLVDRQEAARLLGGVSLTTLGRLPGLEPVRLGRRVLYGRDDLRRYANGG